MVRVMKQIINLTKVHLNRAYAATSLNNDLTDLVSLAPAC